MNQLETGTVKSEHGNERRFIFTKEARSALFVPKEPKAKPQNLAKETPKVDTKNKQKFFTNNDSSLSKKTISVDNSTSHLSKWLEQLID